MKEKKTIEQQVADAILQRAVDSIEVNGVRYEISQPTIATLILVSEYISRLPKMPEIELTDTDKIVDYVLHNACNYRALGDIAAILILGAKNVKQEKVEIHKRFFGLIKEEVKVVVDKQRELADSLLSDVRTSVLSQVITKRLQSLEIPSFFVLTTSLSEANILKQTKEVVK